MCLFIYIPLSLSSWAKFNPCPHSVHVALVRIASDPSTICILWHQSQLVTHKPKGRQGGPQKKHEKNRAYC